MYLKRLEIYGFKSFSTKSVLDFEHEKKVINISAIVGPNGSGKSNIADAVRWVLGEQSTKLLRSKKNEDVIFCGSNSKPRSSYAEITMMLCDNKAFEIEIGNKKFSVSEIEITRKLYRTGESEYLVNKKRVRLLDIQHLLASFGFGQSTYTVIGQGMVDRLLFFNPQERKVLFDEAAGVKQYEIKRGQAIRKLEGTDANIIRLKDILSELDPRVVNLRRLVKRAEGRKEIEAELSEMLSSYYGSINFELTSELDKLHKEKEDLNKKIVQKNDLIKELDDKLQSSRNNSLELELSEIEHEIASATAKRDDLLKKVSFIEGQLNQFEEKTESLNAQKERLDTEKVNLNEKIDFIEKKIAEERVVLQFEEVEKDKLAIFLGELEAKKEELNEKLGKISLESDNRELESLHRKLSILDEKKNKITNELSGLVQKKNFVESESRRIADRVQSFMAEIARLETETKKSEVDLSEKKKTLVSAQNKIAEEKSTFEKTLRETELVEKELSEMILQVDQKQIDEMEKEIKTTLQEFKILEEGVRLQKLEKSSLESHFSGFLRKLNHIFAKIQRITLSLNKSERERVEGLLSKLRLKQKGQEERIRGLVAEIDRLNSSMNFDEEMISTKKSKIEECKKEIDNLNKTSLEKTDSTTLSSLEIELLKITGEIEKLSVEIRDKSKSVSERKQEVLSQKDLLHQQETDFRRKIYEFEISVGRKATLIENQEREVAQTQMRLREITANLQSFSENRLKKDTGLVNELKVQNKSLIEKNVILAGLRQKLSEIMSLQKEKNQDFFEIERKRRGIELELMELHNLLNQININEAKYSTRLEDVKSEICQQEVKISSEVRYEILDQQAKDGLRVKIENLKRKLEAIGGVDPETVAEYEELDARSALMNNQVLDLEKAKTDLEKIIKELDSKIKKQFSDTFSHIAKEFNRYFTILFEGGSADLALGEDDEGNYGIEITAVPPGKKLQNLNVLSGGERTLTSLALLFAILSTNPSPFCLLDEVDAALDEANTLRFTKILQDLAKKTQFLVISHNRETMKSAEVLYGITMDSDHVSKLVSIRLAEALKSTK